MDHPKRVLILMTLCWAFSIAAPAYEPSVLEHSVGATIGLAAGAFFQTAPLAAQNGNGNGNGPGENVCYYCHPLQGPDGFCMRTPDSDGWVDCKNVASGGCDFTGFDMCDEVSEPTGFITDELDLGQGYVLLGRLLDEGVFAHRTCDGRQAGIVYSLPEKQVRLASASAMTITLSGSGAFSRVALQPGR